MELVCKQENFKKAILTVDKITSKQLTLPILKNILLETKDGRLFFSATNLEIGVINNIGAKIEKEGKIAVPVKILSDFVLNLPSEDKIEIKLDNYLLNINCGKYKAKINCLDPDDFPIIPKKEKEPEFSVNVDDLRKVVEKSLFCVSNNDTRIEFTGVNFLFDNQKLFLASTDSFRLVENSVEIKKEKWSGELDNSSVIVPAETLRELNKILGNIEDESLKVFITIEKNQIFFDVNDVNIVSRLINGKYPDYKQIIPENFETEVVIDKKELAQSIKIASVFTKNKEGEIDIELKDDDKMIIKSSLQEMGENEIELNVAKKGRDQKITLNPRFLMDGVNSVDTAMLKIMINDDISPIQIKMLNDKGDEISDYLYIVKPIKK